ncbi:GNAT family protein [Streptococcus pneumoniae]
MSVSCSPNRAGIFAGNRLIGTVSRYWESRETRWLEIGLALYDETDWGQGYGTYALPLWVSKTFVDFPELEHIGLTTWSGNHDMMRLAEKVGFKQEGRICKVRFFEGIYYDSMTYGVLRDEWFQRLSKKKRKYQIDFTVI